MAKPREVRGWSVYATAVSLAFLVLILRFVYADGPAPYVLLPFLDVPLIVAAAAVAIAVLGLHQALWYLLVKREGMPLLAASTLMFIVGLFLFWALPDHLGQRAVFLAQFTAGFVLFLYVPTLSYQSRVFLGLGIAGTAVLFATSLWGPLQGSASLFHPVVFATLAAEAVLGVTLLRLLQVRIQRARAAAA